MGSDGSAGEAIKSNKQNKQTETRSRRGDLDLVRRSVYQPKLRSSGTSERRHEARARVSAGQMEAGEEGRRRRFCGWLAGRGSSGGRGRARGRGNGTKAERDDASQSEGVN